MEAAFFLCCCCCCSWKTNTLTLSIRFFLAHTIPFHSSFKTHAHGNKTRPIDALCNLMNGTMYKQTNKTQGPPESTQCKRSLGLQWGGVPVAASGGKSMRLIWLRFLLVSSRESFLCFHEFQLLLSLLLGHLACLIKRSNTHTHTHIHNDAHQLKQ